VVPSAGLQARAHAQPQAVLQGAWDPTCAQAPASTAGSLQLRRWRAQLAPCSRAGDGGHQQTAQATFMVTQGNALLEQNTQSQNACSE